jgi:hypothetical protein
VVGRLSLTIDWRLGPNYIIEQQTGIPFIIMQHMQPGMFTHTIMQSQQA